MNLVNLFGNKSKAPEPEYFLAIEIHESLIKTALWEVQEGQPQVINVGSYESWTDEESLINGVDSSLDQAVKIIKGQPKRVIFGLPASWMEDEKIHSTKTKLITHLCKELGLDPIGAVTTNRAIAHYLKKREGMPPTVILLEVYTSKVAVSYVYLGAVNKTEEVARSGDLAHDVEEGLTRMDLTNYPARFILTNGGALEEESQQITAFPWTDRLPFKHIPKVETLPIEFSIKAIALTGGIEAVQSIGLEIKEEELPEIHEEHIVSEESNLVIPEESPSSMEELGFSYEETTPPTAIPQAAPVETQFDQDEEEPEFAFSDEDSPPPPVKRKPSLKIALPTLPKIGLPKLPKLNSLALLAVPLILILIFVGYLFFGQAEVTIHFMPQKINKQMAVAIAEAVQPGLPTLVATKKTFSASAQESVSTTGTATVGDKASGVITIGNKSVAPIVLKAGTIVTNDTGKYSYVIQNAVTIASASADSLDTISGKTTGVQVTASKIGAEYNLVKGTVFTVDNYSKSVAAAVSESDFTGGTSRAVNAVSKADQDKLLATATEKIKAKVVADSQSDSGGLKILPLSEVQFTKKVFDHNISEEATTVSLVLEGSLEALVYSEDSLNDLALAELKAQVPSGSYTKKDALKVSLDNPVKSGNLYQSTATIEASLYPEIDEAKMTSFIKGKAISSTRHFFEPIPGFTSVDIKVFPPIPLITKIFPLGNIKFELVGN